MSDHCLLIDDALPTCGERVPGKIRVFEIPNCNCHSMNRTTKRKTFLLRLIAVTVTLVLVQGCAAPEHSVVIRNATVVDVETGELRQDQTIAIDDSTIVFIGVDSDQRMRGRSEVDATGLYAIPGLWDMHVHIEGTDLVEDNRLLLPVYVAYGVTTVRDMASDLGEQVLTWRDEILSGELFGPRIYTAGRKIEGVDSIWKDDLEVATEDEMRVMMDSLDRYRVDFVKVTENTLSAELFLATVREARSRGYRVSGHVPYDASVRELIDAGISSVEHVNNLLRLGNPDEVAIAAKARRGVLTKGQTRSAYLEAFDQNEANGNYERLAQSGVYVTPTLIGRQKAAYFDEEDYSDDAFQRYLTQAFMKHYGPSGEGIMNRSEQSRQQLKTTYERLAAQIPFLQRAGVGLLGGSDSAPIAAFVYPGLGIHEELLLFQDAGLSPLNALQTVTINGARFLGKDATSGTLSVDKVADVVLLRENPLTDISATQSIEAVVARGELLDRVALDSILSSAAARVVELDSERAKGEAGAILPE